MLSGLREKLTTLKEQLRAEKKKTAVMGVLLAILVIVCIKQFGGSSETPEVAVAITPEIPPPSMAPTVVEPAAAQQTAPATPPVKKARAENLPQQVVDASDMPRDLRRDLFTTSAWSSFKPVSIFRPGSVATSRPARETIWDAALSAVLRSQRYHRKEAEEIDQALASLKLQSTMTGSLPMAYISGRLIREGDAIEGFAVVHIDDRRVVVRKGPFTRELIMP